jgi:hypothetical protein
MMAVYFQQVTGEHFQLYPGAIFLFLIFVLLFIFIFKHGLTFEGLVSTANTLGSQPMAILVLIIGVAMLKICHDIQVDTNVAAGVIGCALGLLNNQFAKQHSETTTTNTIPPTVTKTVTSDVGSPNPSTSSDASDK